MKEKRKTPRFSLEFKVGNFFNLSKPHPLRLKVNEWKELMEGLKYLNRVDATLKGCK
jgi:hypothetical protein